MFQANYKRRYQLGMEALTRNEEIWFVHPNGKWFVSNMGRMEQVPRIEYGIDSKRTYERKCILRKNTGICVLETFVGLRPSGMYCLHWDDTRTNNHLNNLRWGTPKDNMTDAARNGRRPGFHTMSGDWASHCGILGGSKGGLARAKALSAERRSEIARKAAAARWNKKK